MKRKADEVKTTDRDVKHKLKMDEIMTMNRQKMTIQCSTEVLKDGIFTETLASDEKQDPSLTAKAASLCWSWKDKEMTLEEYNNIWKRNIKQFNFFVCARKEVITYFKLLNSISELK